MGWRGSPNHGQGKSDLGVLASGGIPSKGPVLQFPPGSATKERPIEFTANCADIAPRADSGGSLFMSRALFPVCRRVSLRVHSRLMLLLIAIGLLAWQPALAQAGGKIAELHRSFANPPDSSRIMVRWWWFGPAATKARTDARVGADEGRRHRGRRNREPLSARAR